MLFVFALGVQGGANANGQLSSVGTTISASTTNPWFILFLELGILQAMIQTPGYLSRGKISEAGEFLEIWALWRMGSKAGGFLFGADGKVSKMFRYAKRNLSGKDNASMSLGGADVLPTGGKQLASLNEANQRGAAVGAGLARGGAPMVAFGGARGPVAASIARAHAAAMASMAGGTSGGVNPGAAGGTGGSGGSGNMLMGGAMAAGLGGIIPDTSTYRGTGGTGRNALAQFSTSLGGSYAADNNVSQDGAPLVQRSASLAAPGSNPWHDIRNRRSGASDYLTQYNLKSIRPGNVNLEENKKHPNENAIDFDDSGTIRKIKHRAGAGAAEIGMLSTVAALASLPYNDGKGHTDARASSATNNAVKDAGKWDAPLGRRMSWGLSRNVPEYVKNLEKDRLEREKTKARITGAMAYVRG